MEAGTMTPRFKHDCTSPGCCTFKGRTLHSDVYAMRSGGLIMRRSDDGPDYSSWPTMPIAELVAEQDAETFHAVQLARA
jgi:hypothetical protein